MPFIIWTKAEDLNKQKKVVSSLDIVLITTFWNACY